ncbi:MAG TPA: hypothetical protein VG714_04375 [Acidobacteriaceae bacterium]|nr:hypothetical protein [Acidobacteriaceae bacterium]
MNFSIGASSVDPASQSAPVAQASTDARHRKLKDAAQQFEGMLLEELLKPMREHSYGEGNVDGDGAEDAGGGDTLSSYASESLATAIARGGGLGIAKKIIGQIDRTATPASGHSESSQIIDSGAAK